MTYDGHHSHLTTIISAIVFHRSHPHRHQRHHHRAGYDHLMPLSPNIDDSSLCLALRQASHSVEIVIAIQTLEKLKRLAVLKSH